MSVIVCGQDDVIPDECPTCGGWLHRVQRRGLVGPHGWRFCSLDCIDDQVESEAEQSERQHLDVRDLLCACEVCTERGLPTEAMRAEYAAYASGAVHPTGEDT
jgi:hypothetical protein